MVVSKGFNHLLKRVKSFGDEKSDSSIIYLNLKSTLLNESEKLYPKIKEAINDNSIKCS